MTDAERLSAVVQSVFGGDISSLSDTDGLNSVPGWDSAGHLNLIMAVEAEFEIEFDTDEFASLTSIGSILSRVAVT